ncbi:MAG TPA: GNAT family N-acetyltransferase, partial [Allocoleopsis sp.]
MSQNIKIQIINEKSPYLEQVIDLGDRNTKTLGFIAEGAFPKFAANDQIIGAIIPDIGCIGYILYRKVAKYNRISITHLCIDESYRGQKITKKLLDKLISMTKAEFRGIFLTCRNDYGIDSMWSRLGFTPQNYRPAKTKGKELTDWWYPYDGDQNLFDYGIQQQLQSKLCVVIDPNIFFYFSQNESIKSAELESLRADWLQTELELCLNDEIYTIINNIKDRVKKKKYINFVPGYQLLKTYDYPSIEVFFDALKKILPDTIEQHKIIYIAKTIASDISIFITDDEQLLSNYDHIYKEFHLEIITPNQLINRLDELRTKPSYQPDRLAGTSLQKVPADTIDQDELTIFYDEQKIQETKAQFKQRLASFLLDKNRFESFVILGNNQLLGLLVYARHKQDELEIVMFRMIAHELSSTLASHLIFYSLSVAIKEKRQFTKITDIYLGEIVNKAIEAEF